VPHGLSVRGGGFGVATEAIVGGEDDVVIEASEYVDDVRNWSRDASVGLVECTATVVV